MKSTILLLTITFLLLISSKSSSQDVLFSQYDNTPHHINPALTGNFDGKARILLNYRNQWSSILGDNAYKTSVFSIDSKFAIGKSSTEVGVGFYTLMNRAGQFNFGTNEYNFVSSIIKNIGDPKGPNHSVALGINFGFANRKRDLSNINYPHEFGGRNKIHYLNISTGMFWKYNANSRFSIRLGSAIHHINRPNVSNFESTTHYPKSRFNIHGKVEFPVAKSISLLPSILYDTQGLYDNLIFGLGNKWFFNADNTSNYVEIGAYMKSAKNKSRKSKSDKRSYNTYALTAKVQYKSFLISFSYDRYRDVASNAYEFTLGYIL